MAILLLLLAYSYLQVARSEISGFLRWSMYARTSVMIFS